MASGERETLYCGVTSDLVKRVYQHKQGSIEGFTKQYDVKHLVWYEVHEEMNEAIKREKRLKKYKRAQKIRLIEAMNPEWNDLYESIVWMDCPIIAARFGQ